MTVDARPRRWWASIRVRITALATLVVAVVLTIVSVLLIYFQLHSALGHLDELLSDEAEAIGQAIADGTSLPMLFDDDRVLVVTDADGSVVMTAGNAESLIGRSIETADDKGTDIRFAGEVHRVVSEPYTTAGGGTGRVVLAEPRDELDGSVERLIRSLLVTVPGAVIALGVLVWFVVGRTLRPVERIRAEVASIGIHQLDHRVADPGTGDEIARLVGTMNSMLDRLEHAVRRQQRFVGDASHELRTPLARMRARLEVDEQRPELADAAATRRDQLIEIDGMQGMVDDLLLLAASDADPGSPKAELVDLDDVVMGEIAAERPMITVDANRVSGAQVVGSRDQLRRIVRNVLVNATAHARSKIAVELREQAGEAVLTIEDDGPGIPPERRAEVLERFTRLDESRTGSGHAGLGLAIVSDLVTRHGGTVEIHSSVLGGALVSVRLPLAPDLARDDPARA